MTGSGAGFFWQAGLMAGLQAGQALGCSGCLGLGSAVPVPHVPGHQTSICDEGVNGKTFNCKLCLLQINLLLVIFIGVICVKR